MKNRVSNHVSVIIAELRKSAESPRGARLIESTVTPRLLLVAAELLEQRYVNVNEPPEQMCGRCKGVYPCICDEPIVYQRVTSVSEAAAALLRYGSPENRVAAHHCLNPDTCNPDKGADGCVCTCRPCKENPLAALPPGVHRWRDIRRPLPEERVPVVSTYAPVELRQLMIAAVEWANGSKSADEDRAKQQRLRAAAEAYAKDAQQPELREARALSSSTDKMLDDLCGVLGGRSMWHELIGRVRYLVSFERETREREAAVAPGVKAKCIYSDCNETQDLQVSHVCLKHVLRDEEAHERAMANAFWDVLCTLESYKYTDWEFVDDDADEEDESRKLAERTEALVKAIVADVKMTAKALGVTPTPREERTNPKETP